MPIIYQECPLTAAERAKFAMLASMGVTVPRCELLGGYVCILPAGHGAECVPSSEYVGCDVPSCALRKSRIDDGSQASWCLRGR